MRSRLALAAALALLCAGPALAQQAEPERVSLVALIANPPAYEGHRVQVSGYLMLEFEGDALYLGKNDFDANLFSNAIWIDTDLWRDKAAARRVSRRYVTLDGVFTTHARYSNLFSGELTAIGDIRPLPSRNVLMRRLRPFPWWRARLPLILVALFMGVFALFVAAGPRRL